MSKNIEELLFNLVRTSLKYIALDSKPITIPQYISTMYQSVLNGTKDEDLAFNQIAKIPAAMLRAMDEDAEINKYLAAHRDEIISLNDEFISVEKVKIFLKSDYFESSSIEMARAKARTFVQKFDDADIIEKLTVVIQFIEENKSFVEDSLNKLGNNDQEFKDISDNIFMIPVSKLNEFINELRIDGAKRAKIFEPKEDLGYGKTMWDEYTYLLIHYSMWPLTTEGTEVWIMCVMEFGQLKFAVDKDKSGGCFIATACYGSYDDSNVLTLRNYRDNYLSSRLLGRLFIKLYYFFSPPMARFISQSDKLRLVTRIFIVEPLVVLVRKKVSK